MNVAKITENYKTSDNIVFQIDIFTSVRVVFQAKKYFYDLNNR